MITASLRSFLAAALLLGPIALAPAQRFGRDDTLRSSPQVLEAFRDVVAASAKSVVRIQADGKDVALGTIVSESGHVLTVASNLYGKLDCKFRDGKTLAAEVVGVDEPHDLALLKVDAKNLVPIEWKSSKKAEPGDWVAVPGMSPLPLTVGVVSVAARKMPASRPMPTVRPGQGGYLGVVLAEDEDRVRFEGIPEGGPAAKGGLKAGDVLLSIDGKAIESAEELRATLSRKKPGDVVTVRVERDREKKEMKVTLGRWPRNFGGGLDMNALGSELSERRGGFPNVLQHDGVLKPADCGGPLLDLDGLAIGINISRAGRTETDAIPSDAVLALLDDLKSGKLAPKTAKPK